MGTFLVLRRRKCSGPWAAISSPCHLRLFGLQRGLKGTFPCSSSTLVFCAFLKVGFWSLCCVPWESLCLWPLRSYSCSWFSGAGGPCAVVAPCYRPLLKVSPSSSLGFALERLFLWQKAVASCLSWFLFTWILLPSSTCHSGCDFACEVRLSLVAHSHILKETECIHLLWVLH